MALKTSLISSTVVKRCTVVTEAHDYCQSCRS